jgi:hypothetical protein
LRDRADIAIIALGIKTVLPQESFREIEPLAR